jgi:hypothetical protein
MRGASEYGGATAREANRGGAAASQGEGRRAARRTRGGAIVTALLLRATHDGKSQHLVWVTGARHGRILGGGVAARGAATRGARGRRDAYLTSQGAERVHCPSQAATSRQAVRGDR